MTTAATVAAGARRRHTSALHRLGSPLVTTTRALRVITLSDDVGHLAQRAITLQPFPARCNRSPLDGRLVPRHKGMRGCPSSFRSRAWALGRSPAARGPAHTTSGGVDVAYCETVPDLVERVTEVELAFSAWETESAGSRWTSLARIGRLTCTHREIRRPFRKGSDGSGCAIGVPSVEAASREGRDERTASPLPANPRGECCEAGSVELVEGVGPAGEGHEERFAGPADLGAVAVLPVEVGGDGSDVGGVLLRGQHRRAEREVECFDEAIGRDLSGQVQRAADVLLVDEAVGQADPAAEPGGEAAAASRWACRISRSWSGWWSW